MVTSPSMATRKHEFNEILLPGFHICNTVKEKALRKKIFKGGYYVMASTVAYMGLHVKCNRVNRCNKGQPN